MLEDTETLFDHRYIVITLKKPYSKKARKDPVQRKWNFKRMDIELFVEILELLIGAELPSNLENDIEKYTEWLRQIMESACNVSTPLVVNNSRRAQMYWWSEEISVSRAESIKARRKWYHSRRNRNSEEIQANRDDYAHKKKVLRNAIRKAKNAAWLDLITSINRDSWGLPYKLVMGKLRKTRPTLAETLDEVSLNRLLDSLFSRNISDRLDNNKSDGVDVSPPESRFMLCHEKEEGSVVDVTEMIRLVKKRPSRNVAPVPDNIKAIIWKRVPGLMLGHLAGLFTLCLKSGSFPDSWKNAILVLIPKGTKSTPENVKARPICLLNEIGKIFERVVANRINSWMDEDEARSLSPNQFGFRRAKSTVDAINKVRALTQTVIDSNGYAIAVGIDIANAFNSIPWVQISAAMENKGFPVYLCDIIKSYLSARKIMYKNSRGKMVIRDVCAGVPQGSVLGPLLWNVAFDSVLRVFTEEGCNIIYYADDTLIIAS